MEFNPHTRLAGECLQPLGHLSLGSGGQCKAWTDLALKAGVLSRGSIEKRRGRDSNPRDEVRPPAGFQDCRKTAWLSHKLTARATTRASPAENLLEGCAVKPAYRAD